MTFQDAAGDPAATPQTGWMSDVQRALALILIGILAASAFLLVVRLIISAPIDDVVDLAKIMLAALVNMGLIALGFFFGNTMAKMAQDAGQQKVVDKLTSTAPPTGGPVAPVAAATPPAWWTKLSDAEKNAITAAGPGDPRVAAFVIASTAGAATVDDLNYLVGKGLLVQSRVAEITA